MSREEMDKSGLALEYSIDISFPYDVFVRNVKDFNLKHEGEMVYSTNSDGKFRVELKENDVNDYIIRLSGWKREKTLQLRRIYVYAPFKLCDWVYDCLDLLETWALDHKGSFHFKYLDVEEPILDAYNVIKGLEKHLAFPDHELQDMMDRYDDITER